MKQDGQDGQDVREDTPHWNLTGRIIGICMEVINELGSGYLESVYQKALYLALRQAGLSVDQQVPLKVSFRGETVGVFYADIVVEKEVLVELKALAALRPEHQAQVINYLTATELNAGLLINFGKPKLEFRRLRRRT